MTVSPTRPQYQTPWLGFVSKGENYESIHTACADGVQPVRPGRVVVKTKMGTQDVQRGQGRRAQPKQRRVTDTRDRMDQVLVYELRSRQSGGARVQAASLCGNS